MACRVHLEELVTTANREPQASPDHLGQQGHKDPGVQLLLMETPAPTAHLV